jgi:Ca2+-binding RTX toxin-like protein
VLGRSVKLVAAVAVAVAVSGLPVAGVTSAPPRCVGKAATIVGTSGVDTIRGTSGPDVIVGGGGGADGRRGDTIYGLGGDDLICDNATQPVLSDLRGGSGNDTVRASGIMRGGPGHDILIDPRRVYLDVYLFGGAGNDVLRSQAQDISAFFPGPGNDSVVGASGAHNDLVFAIGGPGVVVDLRPGTANGQGHDSLSGITAVYGTGHTDVLIGNHADDFLVGRGGDDVLAGRGGSDYLIGKTGADHLDGGPGDDYVSGDKGPDTLLGRTGDDELTEPRGRQANLILAGPGNDTCTGGYRVPPNIERGCETHRVRAVERRVHGGSKPHPTPSG